MPDLPSEPEILLSDCSVQFGRWRITPRAVTIIRVGAVVPLLGVAGWLLQNFLQLRGVVNLLASRIDLAFLALCVFITGFVLTIGIHRKRMWRISIFGFVLLAALATDKWTPKPSTQASVKTQPSTAPVNQVQSGAAVSPTQQPIQSNTVAKKQPEKTRSIRKALTAQTAIG